MRQLILFAGIAPAAPPQPEQEPPASAPALKAWPEPAGVLAGQLHLFSDRSVRLAQARAAIAEARLNEARRALADLKTRFPGDPFIAREAARATALRRRYAAALCAPPAARPEALLTFARTLAGADEPWASLRRAALRRTAEELDQRPPEAATLEGQPPGFYWLEAGALEEARASLARSVEKAPNARALFLLADASLLLHQAAAARRLYLEALLLDPFDPALAAVRDEQVRALPATAHDELELDDDPVAWSAPVGIVIGVLPAPVGLLQKALASADHVQPTGNMPADERGSLARARAFVRTLVEIASPEGRGRTVDLRRTMKQLSPRLFNAYMDRVVRRRGG